MKRNAWPLMLRRASAAALCDMTAAQFERAIAEGAMPQPILIVGEERWSLAAIEAAIGKLAGGVDTDWRKKQADIRNAA